MGPFAAAYLAYKKGEVRSKQEMPAEVMLWILALGLVALFAADISLTRAGGAPAWWPALRLPLTVVATASLVAGALA